MIGAEWADYPTTKFLPLRRWLKSNLWIRFLKTDSDVKSTISSSKLFQAWTIRLQKKYFRTSRFGFWTTSLYLCPLVRVFSDIENNRSKFIETRPCIILYTIIKSLAIRRSSNECMYQCMYVCTSVWKPSHSRQSSGECFLDSFY